MGGCIMPDMILLGLGGTPRSHVDHHLTEAMKQKRHVRGKLHEQNAKDVTNNRNVLPTAGEKPV